MGDNRLKTFINASTTASYAYNAAGNLMQVEAHNGAGWATLAEMDYNGLGQRLSMDAAGVLAHYVMDGDRPLTADSAGNTTFYLYGLGAIGEKTTAWNYSLPDGTNRLILTCEDKMNSACGRYFLGIPSCLPLAVLGYQSGGGSLPGM